MTTRILTPFETQIDRLLSDAVQSLGGQVREYAPACNVWEDTDHVGVDLVLPGLTSDEVTIEAENVFVTVEGKKKEPTTVEGRPTKSYHVREFAMGSFPARFVCQQILSGIRQTLPLRMAC